MKLLTRIMLLIKCNVNRGGDVVEGRLFLKTIFFPTLLLLKTFSSRSVILEPSLTGIAKLLRKRRLGIEMRCDCLFFPPLVLSQREQANEQVVQIRNDVSDIV